MSIVFCSIIACFNNYFFPLERYYSHTILAPTSSQNNSFIVSQLPLKTTVCLPTSNKK